MVDKRPALGRGLSALIPEPHRRPLPRARRVAAGARHRSARRRIRISRGPHRGARSSRSSRSRFERTASFSPILVRRVEGRFEIVAGERRWRAAQRAGLLKVPVVVRDVPDEQLLQVALIENIQREDLNAIEEAQAYRRLADEANLSQEEIATAVGKDRATIANYMRLLRLPAEVRNDLASGSAVDGPRPGAVGPAGRERRSGGSPGKSSRAGCRSARPSRSSAARSRQRSPLRPGRSIRTRGRPRSSSSSRWGPGHASSGAVAGAGSKSISAPKTSCIASTSSSFRHVGRTGWSRPSHPPRRLPVSVANGINLRFAWCRVTGS